MRRVKSRLGEVRWGEVRRGKVRQDYAMLGQARHFKVGYVMTRSY